MSFAAKFGGTCSKCAGRIPAGAMVNYDGRQIRHAPRCPAKGTVTEVPAATARQDESLTDDSKVLGRATYKGKSGYLVLWTGITKEGKRATKLAFRDGTKTFWGNGDVTIGKMYNEPVTFRRLNELRDEVAAQKKADEAQAARVKAQAEADRIAREAQAAQSGKTVAEVTAEEQVAAAEARKDLLSFTREGKNSAAVGERFKRAKDGTVTYYEIVSVEASYYMSSQDCEDAEDMDRFDETPGWKTPFSARKAAETDAERTAREAKIKVVADAKQAEKDEAAAHEAKIAEMSIGMVRIAGSYAKHAGTAITSLTRGSNYSNLFAAVAEIDGTPALYLSFGGYDDYRGDTFVSPATRDRIFAARLSERMAKEGWDGPAARAHYIADQEKYGGCYGAEFGAWVVASLTPRPEAQSETGTANTEACA